MNPERNVVPRERLSYYAGRMTELHALIMDANMEIGHLRQDAKNNGMNVDALTVLGQVRSRDRKDDGKELLDDLMKYARETGTTGNLVEREGADEYEVSSGMVDTSPNTDLGTDLAIPTPNRGTNLFFQMSLGIGVAIGLVWLIH